MHLSDKALLVHLGISQWTARKLDKKASEQVAAANGAGVGSGRYNKSLLPTCTVLDRLKAETALIRKEFYRNTLPWGIEGTFILPTANYLSFMTEYRGKKGGWESLVKQFVREYPQAQRDAQSILGGLYKASDYPTQWEIARKFSMSMDILPVPASGDFRVELSEAEGDAMRADLEKRVADSSKAAMSEVWQRLYDKVEWLTDRLSDPDNVFHDDTYTDAQDLVKMLPRLNLTDDPDLEGMRREVEQKLFNLHPQAVRNDPEVRTDTHAEAKAIMEKMAAFMGAE
jgi:hypothetical protein